MDSLGIDIGTVSVKYIHCKTGKGRGAVVSQGVYQSKGEIEDLKYILSDIKKKVAVDCRVFVGMTSQDILKKTFTIPVLPKGELKEALDWSVSKFISGPLEETIYDCTILGEVKERDVKKQEVFFVGVNRQSVTDILSAFDSAGFRRIALLTDIAFTYSTVAERTSDGSVGIIDIGGRQTSINIFDGKKLMFAREIMTASESFSDALISGFGFSYEEAEKYKTSQGLIAESSGIIGLPLERMAGEIERTANVYAQRYPERPVRRFLITGRGSKMPNLLSKLREFFVEKVEYLTPVDGIEDEFFPAYSLCIHGDNLVNLLPPEIAVREKEAAYGKWARIGAVGACAVLLVLSMEPWNNLIKLGYEITAEKNRLSQKQSQLTLMEGKGSPSHYKEILAAAGDVQKKDVTFVTLMKYLSSRLPREVYVKEVQFEAYTPTQTASKEAAQKAARSNTETAAQATKGVQTSSQQKPEIKENEKESRDYGVTIRGFIVGNPEAAEPVLLDLIVRLQYSGFLKEGEVISREIKEVQGKTAMEFSIRARCMAHEI